MGFHPGDAPGFSEDEESAIAEGRAARALPLIGDEMTKQHPASSHDVMKPGSKVHSQASVR